MFTSVSSILIAKGILSADRVSGLISVSLIIGSLTQNYNTDLFLREEETEICGKNQETRVTVHGLWRR